MPDQSTIDRLVNIVRDNRYALYLVKRFEQMDMLIVGQGYVSMSSFPVKPFEEAMLLRLVEPTTYSSSERATAIGEQLASLAEEMASLEGKAEEVQTLLLGGKAKTASVVSLLARLDEKRAGVQRESDVLKEELSNLGVDDGGIAELFKLFERHRNGELTHDERLGLRHLLHNLVKRIDCHFEKDGLDSVCGCHVEMACGVEFEYYFRADRIEQRTKNAKGHWEKAKVAAGEKFETKYVVTIAEDHPETGERMYLSLPAATPVPTKRATA